MSTTFDVRVGDTWLSTVAGWGDLELKHGPNGPREASWSMALKDNERPACLVRNAPVSVYAGSSLYWSGPLGQPDWDSKTFVAIGTAREGEGAECLTSGGAITSKPNTAIDQAKARGVVSWTRVGNFGSSDIAGPEGGSGVDDPEPGKLNELLNLWAQENDSQWRATADKRLIIAADDTMPRWFILPGAGVLGEADDDVCDAVFLRYFDTTDGQYRTANYPATTPDGGIEKRASMVKAGPMTAARALTIATGIYNAKQAGRIGWTNGLTLTTNQIVDRGGNPADLSLILPGHMARMLDTPDPRTGGRSLDFVIGDTELSVSSESIQVNPAGMVDRSFEQIVETFGAVAA